MKLKHLVICFLMFCAVLLIWIISVSPKASRSKVDSKTVLKLNYESIVKACDELYENPTAYAEASGMSGNFVQIHPDHPSLPKAIKALEPVAISIGSDRVRISLSSGFSKYGVLVYRTELDGVVSKENRIGERMLWYEE